VVGVRAAVRSPRGPGPVAMPGDSWGTIVTTEVQVGPKGPPWRYLIVAMILAVTALGVGVGLPLLAPAGPSGADVPPTDWSAGTERATQTPPSSVVPEIALVAPAAASPARVGTSPVPIRRLTGLDPAKVWIGLKNSDDAGIAFDLRAEAYVDAGLVASGQLNSFAGGSSGFANAHVATIPFSAVGAIPMPAGTTLSIKLLVRNACVGSGHNSGVARLWYDDSAAGSNFGTTIGDSASDYFLRDSFALSASAGLGPKMTVDLQSGAKCSVFKTFGTWTVTP
jgi:hypothetical protein